MIELQELRKEFAGVAALDGINLRIPEGQIHGIVGRSGAGKSTLIRCLTGLDRPTSGTVRIGDTTITSAHGSALRAARRSIGMVFQQANLLHSRTALRNVEQPLEILHTSKSDRRARARELLDIVGLSDQSNSYPAQLSGGQQQRVGIARALATEPKILLCDEPTSALDTETTQQILGLIASLKERLGITVLLITHEMSVVREICDAVTLLSKGRIAHTGSLLEVITQGESPLFRALLPLPEHGGANGTAIEALCAGITVEETLEVVRASGIKAQLAAATVETISGKVVGRLKFTATDRAAADSLVAALNNNTIYAEVVD